MIQNELFPKPAEEGIVNVASVKQLSPFRYPGGKTWLVPRARKWLKSKSNAPDFFIEPFAGGGIISLTVAAEGLAQKVVMAEFDGDIASVWWAIITGDAEWLAQKILDFKLDSRNVREILDTAPRSVRERAFRTILQNRVSHGGIMAPGSGLIKNGENDRGLASRWYPSTLAKRIRAISTFRHKIVFIEGDAFDVIRSYQQHANTFFFIDPPYTAGNGKRAGRRLYKHNLIDHPALFDLMSSIQGDFLMTYDNNDEIVRLAQAKAFKHKAVAMKNTHHAVLSELLIGRDLSWDN